MISAELGSRWVLTAASRLIGTCLSCCKCVVWNNCCYLGPEELPPAPLAIKANRSLILRNARIRTESTHRRLNRPSLVRTSAPRSARLICLPPSKEAFLLMHPAPLCVGTTTLASVNMAMLTVVPKASICVVCRIASKSILSSSMLDYALRLRECRWQDLESMLP